MRILVVKDEPKMARLLQRALNERGDVVDVAMTGEDAVTMMSLAEVDVSGAARADPGARPAWSGGATGRLTVGDLRLDPARRRVWRGAHEIALSAKELALLETFMRRPDQVLTRAHLSTGSRGWCLGKANAVWVGIVATLTPAYAMSSGDAGAGLRRGSDHPA